MQIVGDDIMESLCAKGYYRSPEPVDYEEFERLARSFSSIKRPMELRTGGPNPVLESERGMTPHNDCNHYADCVAWYCRKADGAGDRTFLTEVVDVIESFDDHELSMLSRVGIHLPLHEVARTSIVRREDHRLRIFWSFSAIRIPRDAERQSELLDIVRRFRERVNEVGELKRIQGGPIALDDGQFLIVDDHRFFHGRDPLPAGSGRHLFRCYLALDDPCLRAAALPLTPSTPVPPPQPE